MKLSGYIKELTSNSFVIPIYKNEDSYYFHKLDDDFRILEFIETSIETPFFEKIYLSENFEITSIGAVVFIGKQGYKKYGDALSISFEILNYLNDNTNSDEYKYIKEEVKNLISILKKGIDKIIRPKEEKKTCVLEMPYINYLFNERINFGIQNNYSNSLTIKTPFKETPSFLSMLDNNIVNDILDDPINKEIVILLFEEFLNTKLTTTKLKIFNKPFINEFSKLLLELKSSALVESTLEFREEQKLHRLMFNNAPLKKAGTTHWKINYMKNNQHKTTYNNLKIDLNNYCVLLDEQYLKKWYVMQEENEEDNIKSQIDI
jgi:hypothetical protein